MKIRPFIMGAWVLFVGTSIVGDAALGIPLCIGGYHPPDRVIHKTQGG
ncbi:MAG: hypothetical protein IJN05_12125 [Ruminococcus sp.]|nr:hypothetical protein [Ruminococcus sp.]